MDELVEFFPTYSLSSIAADRANYLNKLLLGISILKLIVDVSPIVDVQLAFGLDVQQGEVSFSSFFVEGASLNNKKKYDPGGEFFEELLEVQRSTMGGVMDL